MTIVFKVSTDASLLVHLVHWNIPYQ